jgi:hypothetical protein
VTGDRFECPRCGAMTWNPQDVLFGWCGRCEDFTRDTLHETQIIVSHLGDPRLERSAGRRLHAALLRDAEKLERLRALVVTLESERGLFRHRPGSEAFLRQEGELNALRMVLRLIDTGSPT